MTMMQPSASEPTIAELNDLSPVAPEGAEVEPMLLLDTTGSMMWPAAEGSNTTRAAVISEALGGIVTVLAAKDSQAEAEAAAGEDAGGLMTITFAGGSAECIDDLSPENFHEKLGEIQWGGGTVIMPGWDCLVETFLEEFGDVPKLDRPQMLALIVTDGEADDTAAFAAEMQKIQGGTHVCIAIMGYGPEHDKALHIYQDIAAKNDHVRVVTFGNTTNPTEITDAVISLLG